MTSRVINTGIRLSIVLMLLMGTAALAGQSVAGEPEGSETSAQEKTADELATKEFSKGLLMIQHGNDAKAITHFEEAIKLDPSSYNTRLLLGKLYAKVNRGRDSVNMFREAIKVKPEDPRGYDLLISLLLLMKKPKEAVEAGEEALANGVPDKYILDLGWAYYQSGMFDKAEERYIKELDFREGKDLFAPHRNLGILYYATGKFDVALDHYAKAEEIADDPEEVPFLIAVLYESIGQHSDANDSINVFKARNKDYAGKANRYLKTFFPYTETPDMGPYIYSYNPDALKNKQEEKR